MQCNIRVVNKAHFLSMLGIVQRMSKVVAANTTPTHEVEEVDLEVCLLAREGEKNLYAGSCAITYDHELILLNSLCKGCGKELVVEAIGRGATHLNCFGEALRDYYAGFGFKVDRVEANYFEGEPPVYYMSIGE